MNVIRTYANAADGEVTITRAKGGRGKVTVTPDGGEPVTGVIRTSHDEDLVTYHVDAPGIGTIPITADEHDTLVRAKRPRRTCDACGGPLNKHGLPPTVIGDESYCFDCT